MAISFRPRLTLFDGSTAGKVIEVPADGAILLGRAEDCALRFDSAAISKHHAKVFVHQGEVFIEDLGSTNGTFVNARAVVGREALDNGSVIGLGVALLAPQHGAIVVHNAAEQLLEEMQLFEFDPEQPVVAGPSGSLGEDALDDFPANGSGVQGSLPGLEEQALDDSLPAEVDAEVAGVVAVSRMPSRRLRLGVSVGLLGCAVILAGGLWQVSKGSQSRIWSQVRVAPTNVQAASQIVITSPDVDADLDYEILFGGEVLVPAEQLDGRLTFQLPSLAGSGAGEQVVVLEVRHQQHSLLRTSLLYNVVPKILGFSPSEARVGDELTITGFGFLVTDAAGRVEEDARQLAVRVGELDADVLALTAENITVRVPMVTRRKPVEVPIEVNLGAREPLEAREFLRVTPRLAAPLDFEFSSTYTPGLDAWQVVTPLGTAFYLKEEAGSPRDSERVVAVCEAFSRLFRLAPDDETLRVDAVALRPGYALRTTSRGGESETLVEFSDLDLETTSLGGGSRVQPHILAFWQATVWNYLLDTFARGKSPSIDEGSPAYHRSLAWLVDNNRGQGGFGRPEARDVEQLEDASREILSMVLLQPPQGFGDLSGTWNADVANVFYPTDDISVRLFLDLKHVAGDLSGQARLEFKDDVAFVRTFRSAVKGDVKAGSPPELVLRLAFEEPIGLVVFEGIAQNTDLEGRFKAGSRLPGEWYAVRQSEE